ncbi:MAG: hypothetical protein N3B17_09060 [Chlorobi bacterium]|jgi:hypothetical protein|nr:hypothetical protein [Chlorobiota bacterium]
MRRVLVVLVVLSACMPPPPPPPERLDLALSSLDYASEDELRSPLGDVVVPLPEQWTLLPPSPELAEGTVGLLLDSALTMALVLQRIPTTAAMQSATDARTLARACFERRLQRTGNTIRAMSDFGVVGRDSLRFGMYEFVEQRRSDTAYQKRTRVAVIPTAAGTVYELALVPIELTLDRSADERHLDSVFRFFLRIVRVP